MGERESRDFQTPSSLPAVGGRIRFHMSTNGRDGTCFLRLQEEIKTVMALGVIPP
ncbi:MAG: hypothetical protein U0411_15025 [Thermodesulfovibrionales bacterium]